MNDRGWLLGQRERITRSSCIFQSPILLEEVSPAPNGADGEPKRNQAPSKPDDMDVENVATGDASRPTSPEESFPADHRPVSIKEGRGEPMLDRRKGRPLAEIPQ